jgi:hypothetical protein
MKGNEEGNGKEGVNRDKKEKQKERKNQHPEIK